jgi:hypothetical protein
MLERQGTQVGACCDADICMHIVKKIVCRLRKHCDGLSSSKRSSSSPHVAVTWSVLRALMI